MSLSGTQQRAWDFPTVGSIGIAHCTMTEEPVLAKESISVFRNSVLEISGECISKNMNSESLTIANNTYLIVDSVIYNSEILINAIRNSLFLISINYISAFYTIVILNSMFLISVKMNSVYLTILFLISLIYISTILNSEKYNSLFLIV